MFCHNIKIYIKSYDICLSLKAIYHKPYGNFKSLLILTYCWKDLLIDFVTGLPILTNWKNNSYNWILIIINYLIKIIYYKLVKVTIDAAIELAKMIIDRVIRYHNLPKLIISDRSLIFISKFWSWLCYFFAIKQKLFTTFYP